MGGRFQQNLKKQEDVCDVGREVRGDQAGLFAHGMPLLPRTHFGIWRGFPSGFFQGQGHLLEVWAPLVFSAGRGKPLLPPNSSVSQKRDKIERKGLSFAPFLCENLRRKPFQNLQIPVKYFSHLGTILRSSKEIAVLSTEAAPRGRNTGGGLFRPTIRPAGIPQGFV